MGKDIHLSILSAEGEILKQEIFDGRNSNWFDNMCGNGCDSEYDYLYIYYGFPENASEDFVKRYEDEGSYFDRHYINVQDFYNWFLKYRPDLDAGWVSTYDKWRIEKKGYIPEDPIHYLEAKDNINDMHFVEFENKYDCSRWLYNYLINNNIPASANIVYCFDW
jgi:hypothetical protein